MLWKRVFTLLGLAASCHRVSSFVRTLKPRQHDDPLQTPLAFSGRHLDTITNGYRLLRANESRKRHDFTVKNSRKGTRLFATKQQQEGLTQDYPTNNTEVMRPLILLLLSQFLLFIGVGAVIPSIPLYGNELGFSSAANGIVISIPSVALLLLARSGGAFADKARKPAMILGMATIAISDLGTALATNLPTLMVARLGLGAGRCISESGERGMLADLANRIPESRGRVLAAQQACLALGIAIGAPLGGIIVETYSPRAAFLCVTVAALIAMTIYYFLPETLESNSGSSIETSALKKKTPDTTSDEADWKNLISENQWRGIALCQGGTSFGFAAKIASIPVLATATLPGGAIAAGVLLSVAGLSGLVGAPIGGFLTDRVGSKAAAIFGGLVSAVALILIPFALSPSFEGDWTVDMGGTTLDAHGLAFSAAVVAWSIGAAAQSPALVALAQEKAPKGQEATALAFPKAFGDGTYIAVPFILGVAKDTVPDIPGIDCTLAGAVTLLGILALGWLTTGSDGQK